MGLKISIIILSTVVFLLVVLLLFFYQRYRKSNNYRIKNPYSLIRDTDFDLLPNELELFFSVSLDMLCIADTNGYFRLLNPEWELTLGYQLSDMLGHRFIDFVHPEDVKATIEAANQLNQKQKVINFLNRYRHKDGHYLWIEWRSYPVGNLIYAAARDITVHKEAMEEIKRNNLWLRESQKNSHIGSYNLNLADGTWQSSTELDAIFGIENYYEKNINGWINLIHPEHADEMQNHLYQHVMNEKLSFDKEYRIIKQNTGEVRWVHGLGNLYYNENGLPANMIGTIQDITEKKLAREILSNSEKKYRILFENMTSGFALHELVFDGEGKPVDFKYIFVNQKFKDIWDFTGELEGRTLKTAFPFAPDSWINNVYDIIKTKEPKYHIEYFANKDKYFEFFEFWVEGNQFAGLFNDVTDRIKIEQEVTRNENRLQSLLNIIQSQSDDVKKLLDKALDEAIKLTQSKIGYVYYYNEDVKKFTLNSWSKNEMEECSIINHETSYELEKTGIWGEAVRQRKPIVLNDFQKQHILKKGYPDDHAILNKFLTVPIFEFEKIVAVIGVANKEKDYDSTDILQLTLLMDTVWKVIEKKKIDEELMASEQKFAEIFNLTPDLVGIIRLDDYKILDANLAFSKITGYTREEFIGKTTVELNLWTDPGQRDKIFQITDEFGEINNYEINIRKKNGELLTCLYSNKSIYFNSEKCILLVIHDITERKKSEELIAYERNMLRELIDTVPDLIYVKDVNCRNLITNRTASELLGISGSEMLGKTDAEIHDKYTGEEFYKEEQNLIKTGKAIINKEERIKDKGGHEVILHTTKMPLRDATGRITGLVGTGHIVTEQKKAEEQIRKLNEELEKKVEERTKRLSELNKELETFVYSVSHDLRAPLRHINGFLKLMYSNLDSPSDIVKGYYEKINTASKRMSAMIDELLTFSRLGRKDLNIVPLDLNLLVSEIAEQSKLDLPNRNIKWVINSLPIVKGDKNLIKIVFENLISNAIKYSAKKEIAIIEAGINTEEKDYVELYIKDNGAGFDMTYSGKLFGIFQRLHTQEEFEGIGIGLANVKQIITKHKGTIRAEGIIEEGATFYITLPK